MTTRQARVHVGAAIATYVAAIVLFLLTRDSGAIVNTIAVLAVSGTVLLVTVVVRSRFSGPEARRDRWTVIGALAVIGGLLLVWWQVGNRPDGVGFSGIASLYLAFGLAVADVRRASWNGIAGGAVLVACAVAVAVGLAGLDAGPSFWAGLAIGLGLLTAPVGLNLVSARIIGEAHPDALPPAPPPWWLIAGVATFGGALVTMLVLGMPLGWALLAGGVVLGLMVAITVPASLDVVIVIGVVAAVALTSQQEVATPPAVARHDGRPAFAALGDSFISGEGAQEFLAGTNATGSNQCRRAPTAYAPLLAEHPPPGVPGHVVFLACSGARTIDLTGENQYPKEPTYDVAVPTGRHAVLGQLAVLDALRAHVPIRFVLLSIGGNDSLFGTIAQTCLLPGDCAQVGQAWLAHLAVVERRLDHTYEILKTHLPHVPVLVIPYPVPLADHTCGYSLFSAHETQFLYGFTQALNSVVHRAADRAGFRYVDTVPSALDDHRICDGARTHIAVNFLRLNGVTGPFEDRINPKNWLHNNLHPNEEGHALIRDAIVRWLGAHPLTTAPAATANQSGSVPDIADIVKGDAGTVCTGRADLEACSTEWGLDQTVHTTVTRGWTLLVLFGGAWMLALFAVGAVRRRWRAG
jgi:lysophospholipase L1-like esterase